MNPRFGVEYRLTSSPKEAEEMAKGITFEQSVGLLPVRLHQLTWKEYRLSLTNLPMNFG